MTSRHAHHIHCFLTTSLLQEVVRVVGGEVGSSAGLAAERLAVTDFLQVVQAAGDALIAVRVEGVRFDEGEMNYFRNSNEKWTTAINGKKKTPATMTAAGA